MWGMTSPYAQPFGNLTKVDVKGPSDRERRRGEQASNQSQLLRLLSSAAPAAGSVIGTALGGPAGGVLGGGIGGIVGALGGGAADEMTRPYEEADLKRRAKLKAIQSVLRGL